MSDKSQVILAIVAVTLWIGYLADKIRQLEQQIKALEKRIKNQNAITPHQLRTCTKSWMRS